MDDLLIEGIVHPVGWSGVQLGMGEGVPWPVPLERLAATIIALRRVLLDRISGKPGDRTGNALRLAAYHFSVTAAAVAEAALAIDAEAETGLVLTGVPEIEWLRGKTDQIPLSVDRRPGEKQPSWLRNRMGRIARAVAWSSPEKWPRALLFPDAMAVTHNDLLRGEAAHSSQAIGFRHADEWLSAIVQAAPSGPDAADLLLRLADSVAAEAAKVIRLSPALEARVARLLSARLHSLLETAWQDLHALEKTSLPTVLWSGTGGNWPARALGIEVMRRGGTVRRFDHGCGLTTVLDPQGAGLIELCVSTEFVAERAHWPTCCVTNWGRNLRPGLKVATAILTIEAHPGALGFKRKKPRVMYVTGAIFVIPQAVAGQSVRFCIS